VSDFFCIHSGLWLCFRGNPGVSVKGAVLLPLVVR